MRKHPVSIATLLLAAAACHRTEGTEALDLPDASPAIVGTLAAVSSADAGSSAGSSIEEVRLVPRRLYTWTTPEQIAQLRASGVLLSRAESPVYGTSQFDYALLADGDPRSQALAAALSRPELARRRFAWPSPWPTYFGIADASYGSELLAVELQPNAWIGRYEPGADVGQRWSFVDMAGSPVEVAAVLGDPSRIGAILHVAAGSSEGSEGGYREYVLCNEAMIARWEYGSDAIHRELAASRDALLRLRDRLAASEPSTAEDDAEWSRRVFDRSWRALRTGDREVSTLFAVDREPRDLPAYEDLLASTHPRYRPTRERVERLASVLDEVDRAQGAAFTQRPMAAAVASVPPAVVQRRRVRPRGPT